jgi:hypothetical protein
VSPLPLRKPLLAVTARLLVVLLSIAPFGHHASAAVVCFGLDGHVTTELASGRSCSDVCPASGSRPDCGPCADVPLPGGSDADCAFLKIEAGSAASLTAVPLAAVPGTPAASLAVFPAPIANTPVEAPPPTTLDAHRTVVLLI